MVLNKSNKGKKCVDSDSDTTDDDLEELEALMARRLSRGKGKFKGKLPIICFSCNKVGHIAARCPDKNEKDERRDSKYCVCVNGYLLDGHKHFNRSLF